MKEVYHYTTGLHFLKIVSDGVLKPSTEHVPAGERGAVWFTTNPDWDETANKGRIDEHGNDILLNREETERWGRGLVRFVVKEGIAPYTWLEYVKKSRIDKQWARSLVQVAIEKGVKPEHWRVSFQPIPREHWLRVDVWREGQWQPVEMPQ